MSLLIDPKESYIMASKQRGPHSTYYSRVTFEGAGHVVEELLYSTKPDTDIIEENHDPMVFEPQDWVESLGEMEFVDIKLQLDDLFLELL